MAEVYFSVSGWPRCTTTRVLRLVAPQTHWGAPSRCVLFSVTGWGPRGDSGSARGRVRATQPAFFFRFPLYYRQLRRGGGPRPGPAFICMGIRLAS